YVDAEDVAAGIGLARWFGQETLRVYRLTGESDAACQRRDLLDLIHRLGGRVTPRMLKEHCRRCRPSDDAERALSELADEGMGTFQVVHAGGRGRPATVFVLADSPEHPAAFRVPVNGKFPENPDFAEPERTLGGAR